MEALFGFVGAVLGSVVTWVVTARQTREAAELEQARYEWLRKRMISLRNGESSISDDDLPMALFWIHQGVLDLYPPTMNPEKFSIRYRGQE